MYKFKIYDESGKRFFCLRPRGSVQGGHVEPVTFGRLKNIQDFSSDSIDWKDEKLKLQTQITELTTVNRRWHKYNTEMQTYIKKLQTIIQEQQDQINNIVERSARPLLFTCNEVDGSRCKCCVIIETLRRKISLLENQLASRPSSTDHSQVVSLQFRLHQAYQHIDHQNRLMTNKGLMKTGLNLLPESGHTSQDKTFSMDGRKCFECDSGWSFKRERESPKGPRRERTENTPLENAENSCGITEEGQRNYLEIIRFYDAISSEDDVGTKGSSSGPLINLSDSRRTDRTVTDPIKCVSKNNRSTRLEKASPDKASQSIIDPSLRPDDSCTSLKGELLDSKKKSNGNSKTITCKRNHLAKEPKFNIPRGSPMECETALINPRGIENPLDLYELAESNYQSLSAAPDCPNCQTVFPPNDDSFNEHVSSSMTKLMG